jgi:hypothetical protein
MPQNLSEPAEEITDTVHLEMALLPRKLLTR